MLRLIRLCALLTMLLFSFACGGGTTRLSSPAQQTDLALQLPALSELSLPRHSAATTQYTFSDLDLLASDSAQITGTTLELQPADISWAVLGGSFPGQTAIQLTLSGSCSNLFVMASDYGTGRWKLIAGPLNTTGSHPLPPGVMRGDDSTFVALLCPNSGTANLEVSLTLDDGTTPAQPVSGSVQTEAGFPLSGVDLSLNGTVNFQTTSAVDGSFSFPAVPPGSYQLTANLTDHAFPAAPLDVTVVDSPVSGLLLEATLSMPDISPYPFRVGIVFGGDPPINAAIRVSKGTNIDVFVHPGTGVTGWVPAYDAAFKDAVLNWNALSDPWGLFHMRITEVEADAEIVVSWIQTFNDGGKLGEAAFSVFSDGTLVLPLTIEMATENSFGPTDEATVRMVAVHEVGHCLGLWDHSDQPTDIMFPLVSNFEIPSRRDLLTIYTLFNTTAEFTTDGRGPAFVGPRELLRIRME